MHLSNQALGAIMMALQESLLHQTDIVPILQGFEIEESTEGLIVKNPPTVTMPQDLINAEDANETNDPNASL
ncbi:hypothetical protein CMI47_23395 [Candidatus Pacearchaeota archaeon]|nr:hypothetical protein [Candidatus Pacearchaeota archaeon]|tara:strand:+ start:45 stop:260 length:216 start_codon:yes stop_codon:yes gene_type:complete